MYINPFVAGMITTAVVPLLRKYYIKPGWNKFTNFLDGYDGD